MSLVSICEGAALCVVCSEILAEENLKAPYAIYGEPGQSPARTLQRAAQWGWRLCAVLLSELRKKAALQKDIFVVDINNFRLPDHHIILKTSAWILNEEFQEGIQIALYNYSLRYTLYYDSRFFSIWIHLAPVLCE